MTLEEYIKEQRESVANMTLAQARQIVANHYGHDDMRIECEKAVWMLLNCADEKINGGWIPVTERLPKDEQSVLFCDIDDDIMIGYHIKGRPVTHFSQDGTYEDMKNVRAWQPLPKPYKAESEVSE